MTRELDGSDVVHVTLVGPTGALSQVDTPVTLDDLVVFVLKRIPVPVEPAPVPAVAASVEEETQS